MQSVAHLRKSLLSFHSSGTVDDERELFDLLVTARPALLNLFDVPPRSEAERKDLQQGKLTINGVKQNVDSNGGNQVISIAEVLDCSEFYVGSLVQYVARTNPNITVEQLIDRTIFEHHERRAYVAECLRLLFDITESVVPDLSSPLHRRLADFVMKHILDQPSSPKGLPQKLLLQIESLEQAIASSQNRTQSAVSETSVQGPNIMWGQDSLLPRLEALVRERRDLATLLFMATRLGALSHHQLERMIPWLQSNPTHPMTYHFLTIVLTAFDPIEPSSRTAMNRHDLATHPDMLNLMKNKLNPTAEWKNPGLKATVLLKWTLFLTEARHRDPTLEHREGFKTDELETNVWNAVQGDAFTYLSSCVVGLEKRDGHIMAASFADSMLQPSPDTEQHLQDLVGDDFKPAVLRSFETLVRSVITHASSELRKIKQRQEDWILSNARSDRSRMFGSAQGPRADLDKSTPPPRNDIAMFFMLIGALFSALPPERGLQFWGCSPSSSQALSWLEYNEITAGKLPAFLQWAIWSTQPRDVDMMIALYEMLAGLAKGQQCSELAYNFMARGNGEVIPGSLLPQSGSAVGGALISWTAIFQLLESWAAASTGPARTPAPPPPSFTSSQFNMMSGHTQQHAPQQQPQFTLTQKDVWLAQAFLRLLANVATYAVSARTALVSVPQLRPIPTLMSLIPLHIPIELKGAIFAALAAFCEPGAGLPGVEICRAVWTLMERNEIINVRGLGGALNKKGVEFELETLEETAGQYPETIPFLRLLSTLIHTPKRIPLKSRAVEAEPINTMPENLGLGYRLPGIGPFVGFVVDQVFLRIPQREYRNSKDRWLMNDLCMAFMERSLASFDLEALLASAEQQQIHGESFLPLIVHPGYEIMARLLTNSSPLQEAVLKYISNGLNYLDKSPDSEKPIFTSTIVRIMRIVHRVLEIQDIFLEVLVPLLAEYPDANMIVADGVRPKSFFTKFDQALSFEAHYAPAIAAYAHHHQYPEIALLSIEILTILSKSPAFSNLTTLLARSEESDRIVNAYRNIVALESLDDIDVAEDDAEQYTGAGAPDVEELPASLSQAVRLAALDLLSQNTAQGAKYPNIAHLLLLRDPRVQQIETPRASGWSETPFHIILDWVNIGVPRIRTKGKEREHTQSGITHGRPLFEILPELAERFYRILYQMCTHRDTSVMTMRYLRAQEDFFVRQLAVLPFQAPAARKESPVEVQYADGARVPTSVSAFTAFLRLRSYIFDLVALDLHVLTKKGHSRGVGDLLELIYGNEQLDDAGEGDWEDETFRPFRTRQIGQSHMRIIEFVQSLSFEWVDSLALDVDAATVTLDFLGGLALGQCVKVDEKGCEIVDRDALLGMLSSARKILQAQGHITSPAHLEKLDAETAYVLESCAVENHRREVQFAVANGFEAWRRLVDMTLVQCFAKLPRDRRETMLFDLLNELPPIIRSGNINDSTAVLLAEVSLSLITKLREDRRSQRLVQSAGVDSDAGSLPAERLHALFRSILECIADNRVELVRGNLYAALINYFHLIASDSGADSGHTKAVNLTLSLTSSANHSLRESSILSDSTSLSNSLILRSSAPPSSSRLSTNSLATPSSSLETSTLAVMKPVVERLMTIICRDATDGTEVWKTVAFMLLDCLVHLSRADAYSPMLATMARNGFLMNFVRGLKEADAELQSVLAPDPDDLNPLYVFEAKMSLLIRAAQTRQGAERLLECRLLPTLADCDFLDTRPEENQAFMDHDSFLPSAIQRYHQLFRPALQLVDGVLATLGSSHTTATNQGLQFLSGHRDTIVIMLKSDEEQISLSAIDEIHLIVSLCSVVFPQVPKSELLSGSSGFGSVHTALLSLAARCLGHDLWVRHVQPFTDTEKLDASIPASGFGTKTKFNVEVIRKEQLIRNALITYLGIASEFTEPDITLVLSPVTTTPRAEERASRLMATIPTVGDAIEALQELCGDLADTLKQITDITAELAARDHIRVENIEELVNLPDRDILADFNIGQKRLLICQEWERLRNEFLSDAKTLLASVEMLLLLLWRHVSYFAEGRHINNPSLKTTTAGVMRHLPAAADEETFRMEAAKKLAPALTRLSILDLDEESTGNDWRSNLAYLEIMSRRLRDIVGLHVEDEDGMGSDGFSM